MKKLLIIAVFAVFSASSAFAVSLTPAIGVSANFNGFAATGTEKNFDESDALKTTTTEHGAFAENFGSIFAEIGIGDMLAVGIDFVPGSFDTPTNTSREGNSTKNGAQDPGLTKVSVAFEQLLTAYARVNLPLGGTYLKAGYSQVDVIVNEVVASGNTYKDTDTSGYTAGLGYDHSFADGLSIRAEVMVTEFDDMKTNNGVTAGTSANGGKNEITIGDAWSARGTISLVKSF